MQADGKDQNVYKVNGVKVAAVGTEREYKWEVKPEFHLPASYVSDPDVETRLCVGASVCCVRISKSKWREKGEIKHQGVVRVVPFDF